MIMSYYAPSTIIDVPWPADDPDSKLFQVVTFSSDMFADPLIPEKGLLQSKVEVEESTFSGKVNCSLPFTSTDGRTCLAVGCAEGLWIGYRDDSQSLRRVLDLKMVTQCAVLEESGIFLVLANKTLFAYEIESLVASSLQGENASPDPRKLNGSTDVQFFSVGSLEGKTLVIYMTRQGLGSVFHILEPIDGNIKQGSPLDSQLDLRPSRSTRRWFRIHRDLSIPSKAYDVVFLTERIAILCKKGFEIMDLSESCSITIPQLHGRSHKELAKRCQSSRPLGIFRSGNDEFFLCYDKFGLYVNRYGDLNPTKGMIEWEIIADHVAYHPPYVLVFNACFIEVRHIDGGRLCQIISGRSLQCTWNGYGSSIPLSRPDSDGAWGEIPAHGTSIYGVMRTGDWSHEPSPSHIAGAVAQSVFELVPTAFNFPVEEFSSPARS